MDMQLTSNGVDAPLFGVVVAQDLRLQIRGNGHGRILYGGVDERFEGPGRQDSRPEQTPSSAPHRTGTAQWMMSVVLRKLVMRQSPPPSPPAVDHPGAGCVNPDASRFAAAGNGGNVRHGGRDPFEGVGKTARPRIPKDDGL